MKTLKLSAVLCAVILSMFWLSASAKTKAPTEIAVIVKATTSQYWQTVFQGAEEAAERLDVKLWKLGAPAETDIAKQISIMQNVIGKHPDAIVLAPTKTKPLADSVEAATNAGIPVVIIDSGVATDQYASFLRTNNHRGGRKAADALARCIKERYGEIKGKIAYLTSVPGAQSMQARDEGFVHRIKKAYPGLEIVAHRIGQNRVQKALNITTNLLTRYPNLVGLFADNALMGSGAGAAIEQQGAADRVCLVAYDASDQEVAYLKSGVIDALVVQDPYMMGYAGVWYAVAAHNGVILPHEVDTGVHVVTTENMDELGYRGVLYPEKRKLTPFLGRSSESGISKR